MTIDGKTYKIADLMRKPVAIPKDSSLRDTLAVLLTQKTNMGVVVDTDDTFLGTVTTVDVIKAVLPDYLEGDEVAARFADDTLFKQDVRKAADKPVCDFVDREEATITEDANLLEAAVLAVQDERGRIVVLDTDKKPIGILSRTEIKKVIAAYLDIANELG